jgi:hypothetical protein
VNFFKRKTDRGSLAGYFTARRIEFVGEQTGPVEDELKAEFVLALAESDSVCSAYLARISYGDPSSVSVALCICSTARSNDCLQGRLAAFLPAGSVRMHISTSSLSGTSRNGS